MNRLIAIKLLWKLLYYLSQYFDLIIQIVNYSKYSGSKVFVIQCSVFYTYIPPLLRILHQIHIFVNSKLGFSQPIPYASNCIRIKPLKCKPIKPNCHWPTRFWLLPSSYYLSYPMRKLMFIIKGRNQLHPTSFSTLPLTVVLKDDKPHALTSRQSIDRLDNLSCIRISEWEYTFRVTYILRWRRRFSTETGGVVNMVKQSFAQKSKCGSQYQNSSHYLSRDFNPEDLSIGRLHME